MEHIPQLSEAVYTGMCNIAGTPTVVSTVRKSVVNVERCASLAICVKVMLSGSRAEGFNLRGSDIDFMIWPRNHNVLCDINQADRYHTENCTLILMEKIEGRPGFVTIHLLTPTNNVYVQMSCVKYNDITYLSSSLYRGNGQRFFSPSIIHGPCVSGNVFGVPVDFAPCFHSELWPTTADQFISRCRAREWPAHGVLDDIISAGCHVVPVGIKGSPQEDMEWRMSFSSAELKIVHSMNHTQLMCYGLLKIFLKEALDIVDENGQPLLCSYFMKTVLFWVIQGNRSIEWSPSNLLSGFWICFKDLLSSVQRGYLPNFFIPENNMFHSKIHGHSQKLFCKRLYKLHNIGIACLLQCPSLQHFFSQAKIQREYIVTMEKRNSSPETGQHRVIDMVHVILRECPSYLHYFGNSLTMLSRLKKPLLFTLVSKYMVDNLDTFKMAANNKSKLEFLNYCQALLKLNVHFGCLSELLYLALFYCVSGQTQKAFPILEMMRRDITQPNIIYAEKIETEAEMEKILKQHNMKTVVKTILIKENMIIKELEPEIKEANRKYLHVPPYIMTLMLLIVCNHGNLPKQQEILHELYFLVHFDDGRYVCSYLRDISWQILGVCQQICGDHQGALRSYHKSLRQEPFHQIQEVTIRRIQDAISNI